MDQKTLTSLGKIVKNTLKEILKTDTIVEIEDVFTRTGNRSKTASKQWQTGCMLYLTNQGLIEKKQNTYLVKERQAIQQIINEYPLTQEIAICGHLITINNYKHPLNFFQRLSDEQLKRFKQATKILEELSKGEFIRRDHLFLKTEKWQPAFMKRLITNNLCLVRGKTRWVEYKIPALNLNNDEIIELLFPKWYKYVRRVTSPNFLHIAQKSNQLSPKSSNQIKETDLETIILEKLIQYLQVLEYQSTRLSKIEIELKKLNHQFNNQTNVSYENES